MRVPAPPSLFPCAVLLRGSSWRAFVPLEDLWCNGLTVTGISITACTFSTCSSSLFFFFQQDLSSLELTISFSFILLPFLIPLSLLTSIEPGALNHKKSYYQLYPSIARFYSPANHFVLHTLFHSSCSFLVAGRLFEKNLQHN
jgi:hypothetical protein